jgi:fluoroacetyl-CoA thioesterase
MTLRVGLVGEVTLQVEPAMLASAVGSGDLEVFSTPWLIAAMERAACRAVEGRLAEGQTTVGVRIDVQHLAATPPGAQVRARAELVEIDGRKLVFRVEAFDVQDRIGEGQHERAIVDGARLVARAAAKLGPAP